MPSQNRRLGSRRRNLRPIAALPEPVVAHSAPQHAAQPLAHQSGPADAVPIVGLAVEIAAHAHTGKNRFEIRLDPPELRHRCAARCRQRRPGHLASARGSRGNTGFAAARRTGAGARAAAGGPQDSDSGLQFSLRDQSLSQQNQNRDMPAMARMVVPDENLMPARRNATMDASPVSAAVSTSGYRSRP